MKNMINASQFTGMYTVTISTPEDRCAFFSFFEFLYEAEECVASWRKVHGAKAKINDAHGKVVPVGRLNYDSMFVYWAYFIAEDPDDSVDGWEIVSRQEALTALKDGRKVAVTHNWKANRELTFNGFQYEMDRSVYEDGHLRIINSNPFGSHAIDDDLPF